MSKIPYYEMPPESLKIFSKRQLSYLDEFDFESVGKYIIASYANDLLAIWDGIVWRKYAVARIHVFATSTVDSPLGS